ncbi:MAG: pitrilysin family protein [Acidobacteriota bacterium]
MTVIFIEQHEMPIVNFQCLVRAGSVLDPVHREGLASLTAQLLRRGTSTRSAESIDAAVDFVGAEIELEIEHDFATVEAEFLTKDIPMGIDLLSDILQRPVFRLAEVAKMIKQEVDRVRQDKDQAEDAISRFFDAYLLGIHPYGRPTSGDEISLASIRRTDVLQFYHNNYGPGSTTLVIAGDFNTVEVEKLVTEKFGRWQHQTTAAAAKIAPPPTVKGRRLLLVDKPDLPQTFFQIGGIGVARTNPDRIGLEVVNTIFGGRFTSMLNDALRVSSGLTYGVSSEFTMRMAGGTFVISSFTQNATTARAIDLAVEILRKLHAEGLSDQQIQSARNYLKGQFPPRIETSEQLAHLAAELEFYGLDESEITTYFAKLDQVTVEDTKRIIATYYPLDDLVFVLIGKAEEIRGQVKKYAEKIDERPIDRPGFR